MITTALRLPTRRDHLIGIALALGYFIFLIATSSQVGVPRDESIYFDSADKIAAWVDRFDEPGIASFSKAEIERGFRYNREHPVLMKTLFGVSHHWLVTKWGVIDSHILGYRLPTMLMAGLSLWLTFLFGLMIRGRAVGVIAAACLAFMPRVFFHNHLACFDAPVTFMWLLICYTFLRASRSRRWAIACGVALGLGMATKLNIFFLPFILLGIAAFDTRAFKRRTGAWRAADGARGPLTYYSWIAVSMIGLGALVFFAHWPWLWHDTVKRVGFYISFHARHVHYPVDYLGTVFFRPPFPMHLPVLFTILSVPVVALVFGAVGLARITKDGWRVVRRPEEFADRRSIDLIVLANFAAPIAIIALPFTPIFGHTKHWMPAMPFMAVLAGVGLVRVGEGLRLKAPALAVFAAICLLPAVWATHRYGAHGPTYYNAIAGGPPGAASIRMPRDFWGYGSVAIVDAINAQAEPKALTFWHNATHRAVREYQRDGLLRKDLRISGDWSIPWSDWAIYHDAREKLPEELDIWRDYGTRWPVDGLFIDGVQSIAVYRRPLPRVPPPAPANP